MKKLAKKKLQYVYEGEAKIYHFRRYVDSRNVSVTVLAYDPQDASKEIKYAIRRKFGIGNHLDIRIWEDQVYCLGEQEQSNQLKLDI